MDLTTEAAFRVEQFRDYLALEAGDSAHTVANYVRDVRRLAAYAGSKGARRPEDVTSALLREFVYALKDLGLAPATIRRQISAVRTYYRYLVGEGHAARDPSERLESPRQWRRLPTVLSVAEIDRLLAAPNTDEPLAIRDRALLEFAYATGARVSELVGLKLQDVLYEDGLARMFGKGAKERIVPVGRRALGAVALYAREIRPGLDKGNGHGLVFLNARGTPLSRVGAWSIIKRAARLATCSRAARTCALSRKCSATWTSPLRSCTRTSTATICGPCTRRIIPEAEPRVSRAFVKEDPGEPGPRRNYGLPPRDDPGFDAAAAEALLEAAGEGETASAERATGYYWGESKLRPYVERILERAQAAGDERLEQLAKRFLS